MLIIRSARNDLDRERRARLRAFAAGDGGTDSIQNGIALSGTAHWMFDRGLIGLSDDLDIMISRQVNDYPSVEAIINKTGRALAPERAALRPHPAFLAWHRDNCFKH